MDAITLSGQIPPTIVVAEYTYLISISEIGVSDRTVEDKVAWLARFALDDVGRPRAKKLDERSIVEIDHRHLRTRLDAELVKEWFGRFRHGRLQTQ